MADPKRQKEIKDKQNDKQIENQPEKEVPVRKQDYNERKQNTSRPGHCHSIFCMAMRTFPAHQDELSDADRTALTAMGTSDVIIHGCFLPSMTEIKYRIL